MDYEDSPFSSRDTPMNDTGTVLDTCRIPLVAFLFCIFTGGEEVGPRAPIYLFCFALLFVFS